MKSLRNGSCVFALCALAFAGCAVSEPLSSDPQTASRQAITLIPRGTSEAQVKKILASRGFQLSRMESDNALNHLLLGTYTNKQNVWLLGVVIVNGRAVATSVTVTSSS